MILVTSCPECKTTFRISVGILEKAGGQVRCGRCASIFDANAKLREVDESEIEARPAPAFKFELQPDPEPGSPAAAADDRARGPGASPPASGASLPAPGVSLPAPGVSLPAPGVSPPAPGASPPAPGASLPAPGASLPAPGSPPPAPHGAPAGTAPSAGESSDDARTGDAPDAELATGDESYDAAPGDDLPTDSERGDDLPADDAQRNDAAADEASSDGTTADDALAAADAMPTDSGDAGPQPDTEAPLPATAGEPAGPPAPDTADGGAEHIVLETPAAAHVPARVRSSRPADASSTTDELPELTELPDWLRPASESRRPRTRLWAGGVALAVLALVGQLVHHYRDELVAQPAIGPVLAMTYAGFGSELRRPVDLEQFRLQDLTAVAEPSGDEQGWLVIETRVHNSGPRVQPFPHIFVRLLDRWEDTVAARYFAPREYAVTPISDIERMNVGSTVDAQFIIMDPGPSATGFELELCFESSRGFECESDADGD